MIRSLYEAATFACVGLAASVVHVLVAIVLIENLSMAAWQANIVAFLCALPVSYFGHSLLTFSARNYNRAAPVSVQTLQKFTVTALGGFALNQLSVVIFISWLGLPHRPVMFVTVFGVAGLLFLVSKFWAFRGGQAIQTTASLKFRALTEKASSWLGAQLLSVPRTVSDTTERNVFLAILALGAFARFITLGQDSLWVDEGYTLGAARFPLIHLWTVPFDVHPPLFYSLVKLSLLFGESETILRSTSAIASTLTLIPFYLLGRALMGRVGGLVAMAVLAMAFTHLVYASDARNYALLGLFLVIANAALYRLVQELRATASLVSRDVLLPVAIYTFAAACALYTHNSALIYLFVGNAIWCLNAMVRSPVDGFAISLKLAAANVLPLLLYLPWLMVVTSTSADFVWLDQASPGEALMTYLLTILPNKATTPGVLVVLAIMGLGSVIAVRRGGDLALVIAFNLLAFPMAAWLFGYVYKPIYMERVILPAIYGAALAIGVVAAFVRQARLAYGLACLALVFSAVSAVAFLQRTSEADHVGEHPRMNLRGAFQDIAPGRDSALVLCDYITYPLAEHYAPGVDAYILLRDGSIVRITRESWSGVFSLRAADRPNVDQLYVRQSLAAGGEILTVEELADRYAVVYLVASELICNVPFAQPLSEKLQAAGLADAPEGDYAAVITHKFVRPGTP